jgi:hypothetical protein
MLRRYVLVKLLEDLRDGEEFSGHGWPQHLTIVPNFSIGWDEATVRERVQRALAGQRPHAVAAQHEELFGPRRTVPVTVLEPIPDLIAMHSRVVDLLINAGAAFEHPAYVQRGYRPHVTVTSDRRLNPGDRVIIDSISVVDLQPRGDSQQRKVLHTISLA